MRSILGSEIQLPILFKFILDKINVDNFSKEDLQTAIEFIAEESADFPIYVEQTDSILRWWAALRVLEVNNKEKSKDADREGKITYSFSPSIQRAISEYLREVNGKELQE